VTTDPAPSSVDELGEAARTLAWRRWEVLAPTVHEQVPLARAGAAAGVPQRTAQRWLSRYRSDGLAGLARAPRGVPRTHPELVALIEGLAVSTPRYRWPRSRRVAQIARVRYWAIPSYSTVHEIVTALDPQLMTLAREGAPAWRDRYELVLRRQAERPNQIWQADHTQLDILIRDADGAAKRPWLTVVLDDHSRAVPGYTVVFLGAPSTLNLSLAMRQAIWFKTDPSWAVHGLPEVLYADHGSDFTSHHLAQVCVDLHIHLIHSIVARPQGRGKVERIMGSITTELLPELPGHLVAGKLASPPALTLPQLIPRSGPGSPRSITDARTAKPLSHPNRPG
jgi:putative transposase